MPEPTGIPQRPNILFIMTDQQRYDQMGYTSGGYFETPNLDRLARSGIIFDNAYSTSTVCAPARGSLLTGLNPHRFAKACDGLILQEGFWTFAHELRKAGYQTGYFGKGHFWPLKSDHGFDRMETVEHMNVFPWAKNPVDDYLAYLLWQGKATPQAAHLNNGRPGGGGARPFPFEAEYHPTAWTARGAIDFLKECDPSKPFFTFVSFEHPHAPYDPPEPYASRYSIEETPLPEEGMEVNDSLPPKAKELMHGAMPFGYSPVSRLQPDMVQRVRAYIRALIYQIDEAVGQILDHVNLDNTLVFFSVDHGDYYGNRGLMAKTPFFPLDDLARVPFFCAGAGIPQGRRAAHCIQSSDIAPTFLELAGLPVPVGLDARSLVPHFGAQAPEDDRIVYTSSQLGYPMVRKGNIKFFRHNSGEELLFDLEKDPLERVNRAGDTAYADAAAELRAELAAILAKGVPDLPRFDGKE